MFGRTHDRLFSTFPTHSSCRCAAPFHTGNHNPGRRKVNLNCRTSRLRVARWPGIAWLALALGTAVAASAQSRLAIGPYVQNVGKRNATICWATVSGEVTVSSSELTNAPFREYQMHTVPLRGLKPATTYTYTVTGDAGEDGRCTFTTVPEGEHAFTFTVISDTQNRGNAAHRPLIEQIRASQPDLLFNVGDLVADGRNLGDWEEFFRVEGELLRNVPLYAVLGNHDRAAALYFQFFVLPGNERYYSFNRGTTHFVVLDSPGPYAPEDNQAITPAARARFQEQREQYWREQIQWLQDDLAGHPDAKYIFVFLHHPLYSVKRERVKASRALCDRFGGLFQAHAVTAVFSGHDHHYHHAVAGGVHFVDGGAAGGKARPIEDHHPETVKSASVESFMRVEVGLNETKVWITDVAGNTVDEFVLMPRQAAAPTSP